MSERKDEKWLDEQLRRAVDGAAPVFDAESWKRKHSEGYELLLSRGSRSERSAVRAGRTVRAILIRPFSGFAVAATIIVAVTLFFVSRTDREPDSRGIEVGPMAQAPAEIVSFISLRGTYRQGGVDALDRQLDDALRLLGPRPDRISPWESLEDSEG